MATRSFRTRYPNARRRARNRPLARLEAAEAATGRSTASTRDSPPFLCARDGGLAGGLAAGFLPLPLSPRARGPPPARAPPARRRHRGFRRGIIDILRGCVSLRSVRHAPRVVRRAVRGRARVWPSSAPHRRRRRRQTPRTRRDECVCYRRETLPPPPRFASHNHHRFAHSPPSASASSNVASMYGCNLHISAHPLSFPSSNASGSVPTVSSPRRLLPSPPRRPPREIRRHP